MKILITGCAGFIGYHIAHKLIKSKHDIVGIDNINDYYDVNLKIDRLKELKSLGLKFKFKKLDLSNYSKLKDIFKLNEFDIVYHLAAQAGVRDSVSNPKKYFKDNIQSYFNILECVKLFNIKHFIFASSSSVYGNNSKIPYDESQNINNPESFYAASKSTNELMARSYSNIYGIKMTGLRFFTVYGPFGRPDMALYNFTKNIFNKRQIKVFNYGHHKRDFIYIKDVVILLEKLILRSPKNRSIFEVYNVGNNKPIKLLDFINIISKTIRIKPKIKYIKKQIGDVAITHADSSKAFKHYGFSSETKLEEGIYHFIEWYKKYNNISDGK
tara:strand:- start:66 stop:1046 length:981 start_codon:yes stop_codon:yes gene_type:complete